jgi:hypothetical protein
MGRPVTSERFVRLEAGRPAARGRVLALLRRRFAPAALRWLALCERGAGRPAPSDGFGRSSRPPRRPIRSAPFAACDRCAVAARLTGTLSD